MEASPRSWWKCAEATESPKLTSPGSRPRDLTPFESRLFSLPPSLCLSSRCFHWRRALSARARLQSRDSVHACTRSPPRVTRGMRKVVRSGISNLVIASVYFPPAFLQLLGSKRPRCFRCKLRAWRSHMQMRVLYCCGEEKFGSALRGLRVVWFDGQKLCCSSCR